MPTTNLTLGFLAYTDQKPGNNPMIRNFDLKYQIDGIAGDTPLSQDLTIPPQSAMTVFSGVRTVAIDGTTQFTVSRPYPSLNTFRFNWVGGTNPALRTNRAIGVSNSTQVAVLTNGPVATYSFGTFATATDSTDTPNIVFTAISIGTIGNSISLVFNGVKATATDTIDSPNIVFTANNAGTAGNSISLSFNGSSTVASVVGAWNTDNPGNQVSYTGLGSVIPASQVINLSGGSGSTIGSVVSAWNTANPGNQVSYTGESTVVPVAQTVNLSSGTLLSLPGVVNGDILRVDPTAGFSPSNQGEFSIIGVSGSTVSVLNQNAVVESITLQNTGNNSLLIYGNGAAGNQPQIQDSVVISAGFSPATFGTYQLIDVTPFWFDVNITEPQGIPLEAGIMPGAAGMIFYSSSKSAVMVAAQDRCSVRLNGDTTDNNLLEPTSVGDPMRPALYFKHGTAYQVVINNLSLNPLSVIVATVE